MREVILGAPPQGQAFAQWVQDCMKEIEDASRDNVFGIHDDFTVQNVTATRTIDPTKLGLTVQDVAHVLATLISDHQKRGTRRGV